MAIPLNEKAVLVDLRQSNWGNSKTDKKASKAVTSANSARDGAAKVVKSLVPKDLESLKALTSAVTAGYNYHNAVTQPWIGKLRIVPIKNLWDYRAAINQAIDKIDSLKSDFLRDYEQMVTDGQGNFLGGLYDPRDYPHPSEMADKFGLKLTVLPVPTGGEFSIAALADGEAEMLHEDLKREFDEAMERSQKDSWDKVYKAVKTAAERLSSPGKLYDSVIGNLLEITSLLPGWNLTDDPRMEQMRQDLIQELCQHDTETIKKNKSLRASLGQKAYDLVQQMPQHDPKVVLVDDVDEPIDYSDIPELGDKFFEEAKPFHSEERQAEIFAENAENKPEDNAGVQDLPKGVTTAPWKLVKDAASEYGWGDDE